MLNTFRDNVFQQYRLVKYIKDLLNNWFSDPANILDLRLAFLLYRNGELKKLCFKIGTAFNSENRFIGITPSITIGQGTVTYQNYGINFLGNPDFAKNTMQAPVVNTKFKTIPIKITITTLNYLATLVLTELILQFIAANINLIQADCTMLDHTSLLEVKLPVPVKPSLMANAKLLYKSLITLLAQGHISWATDTQGPVFQGISYVNKL